MKILYIGLAHAERDGAAIYDQKLTDALLRLGHDVERVYVDRVRPIPPKFPLWLSRVADNQIDSILEKRSRVDYVVLSHEALAKWASILRPDAFIVHNLLSDFTFPGRLALQSYFRVGSNRIFVESIGYSRIVCFLSVRELDIATRRWPALASYLYLPPGIREEQSYIANFNHGVLRLGASRSWYPKRVSEFSEVEMADVKLACGTEIIREEDSMRSFALIEDRFLAGFKLKLLEMLGAGDMIFTCIDLLDEVEALGVASGHVVTVSGPADLIVKLNAAKSSIASFERSDFVLGRDERFREQNSWVARASALISKLRLLS